MNKFFILAAFCLCVSGHVPAAYGSSSEINFSQHRGSEGVGGGDLCEDRIQSIRDDLKSWILNGGANTLQQPKGLSTQEYKNQMLKQIQGAKIRCVGNGDAGYPVEVSGTPKVCRFDRSSSLSLITCDFVKFQSMSEADQYVLTHHEYAGLADIELPNGSDSDYQVSNQITKSLADQVVKKLVVRTNDSDFKDIPDDRLEAYKLALYQSGMKSTLSSCESNSNSQVAVDLGGFYQEAQSARIKTEGTRSTIKFETLLGDKYKFITTIDTVNQKWNFIKLQEIRLETVNVGTIENPKTENKWVLKYWYLCK